MRSRAVRLTLTLLAVVAIAAAAYFHFQFKTRLAHDEANARTTSARLAEATRMALELRAAQQAYVAAGQSEDFWIAKVAGHASALQESLTALRVAPLTATSLAAIDRASEGVEEFLRVDRRAKEQASSGQKLLASDLIFSDGLEASGQIVAALDEMSSAETSAAAEARQAAGNQQAMYTAGAAGVALVVLLLLTPGPKPEPAAAEPFVVPVDRPVIDDNFDLRAALDAKEPVLAGAAPPAALALPALSDVAEVCTQLARLSDTATLPTLLQRTALALDASGVVLWLADPTGSELTPVAAHGYPEQTLSRMGTLPRDGENVTAAAFRTGLLQIVKADTMSNGAIAAPLVNQAGCIGVMSAEVRHEGEAQPARLAIASIVAAQLATLVAPAARSDAAPRSASL